MYTDALDKFTLWKVIAAIVLYNSKFVDAFLHKQSLQIKDETNKSTPAILPDYVVHPGHMRAVHPSEVGPVRCLGYSTLPV